MDRIRDKWRRSSCHERVAHFLQARFVIVIHLDVAEQLRSSRLSQCD